MALKKHIVSSLVAALLFSSSVPAQMNLSGFSSWATRTGQSVPTYIDSLLVDTKVSNGLVVTRVTMTVTPGGYVPYYYYSTSSPAAETSVDSIEMTLSFRLPTDFVADSMWLWVNGVPQEAYIQDRNLAASQYQQIVGRRRDPALLQYNGSGWYSLRIFPAASYAGRKIAIQFNHTLDEDSAQVEIVSPLVTAALPFTFDTANLYNYYYSGRKRPIAFARLSCQTTDRKRYTVAMPGLGSGEFSHVTPCTLTCRNIFKLGNGALTSSDPSGRDEYLWAGRDLRSTRTCAGFSTPLRQQELTLLPEPDVRIIVLDVRTSSWNWNDYYRLQAKANGWTYSPSYYSYNSTPVEMWNRAQKYAMLALKSYVKNDQKFNVVISEKKPWSIFKSPVPGTDANKHTAIAAILNLVPDQAANTLAALQNAAAQADKGIVFLISDLYQPYNYYAAGTTYPYQPSVTGIAYDSMLARIGTLFRNTPGLTLFTISDDWKLNPSQSGGYSMGGLRYAFVLPCTTSVIDGRQLRELYLPPLFGSSNTSGFQKITVSSRDLDDIVFTLDNRYYYGTNQPFISGGGGVAVMVMPARTSAVTSASPEVFMRVAGRASKVEIHKPLQFTIAGKTGGLSFTREITAVSDNQCHDAAIMRDVQWAFRKTEWLYADNWLANAGEIKQIGKEYHIVTRQTSLLALEPGMNLWPDTLLSNSTQDAGNSGGVAMRFESSAMMALPNPGTGFVSDQTYGTTGITVDSIPLDNLTEGNTALFADYGRTPSATSFKTGIVSIKGSNITLQLPPAVSGTIIVALYDLNGRRLASQTIDASRSAGGRAIWNLDKGNAFARGNYMLRVTGGGYDKMFRIPLLGK